MSVKRDHEHERTEHMMPRLQQPHQRTVGAWPQSRPGLCGTLVDLGKDTNGTPVFLRRKAVGVHETTNDNKTKTDLESNVPSGNRCSHTLGILHHTLYIIHVHIIHFLFLQFYILHICTLKHHTSYLIHHTFYMDTFCTFTLYFIHTFLHFSSLH